MNACLKKQYTVILAALGVFALAFQSCMQWDKTDENPALFGSWHLLQIMINGAEDADYENNPNIMFSFQGKVFNAGNLDDAEIYGSWSYAGEVLTLIASYNAGSGYDKPDLFNPFPVALHFPAGVEQIEITITKIGKTSMQWQYIDQNGDLLTYNFKKYPD